MISNSGATSTISFFTPLARRLELVHFQSWTSSAANLLSKQFSKLATPLSGSGTSIQLRTYFLVDWHLPLFTAELMKHSLDIFVIVALEELSLRIHVHLVVCYQQIVATQLWQRVLLALDVSPFLLQCVLTLAVPTPALANFFLPC